MKTRSKSRLDRCSFSKGGAIFSSLSALIILAWAGTACFVLAGKLPATAGKLALVHSKPTKVSYKPLTFAERVAYQRPIEDVYWRRRVWSKPRSDPNPSLPAVMSQA